MQTIRGFFLIVPFFIKSICSLLQEQTNINQSLSFVDEIILETTHSIKKMAVILVFILMEDDPLFKPYVLSALKIYKVNFF